VRIVVRQLGQRLLRFRNLPLHQFQLGEQTVQRAAAHWIELDLAEPADAAGGIEQARGGLDEALVEQGVNAVLEPGAVVSERGALGGLAAQQARAGVGAPDCGQVVEPQQMRQYGGVDLVGLDLGLRNGAGQQRIGDGEAADMRSQHIGDFPGVEGGLQRDLVLLAEMLARELGQGGGGGGKALTMSDAALVVHHAGLDFALVEIQSGEWHTEKRPFFVKVSRESRAACRREGVPAASQTGERATIYASSKLNRVGRRGSQLRRRARSP
jgi:hypothetical protein